MSIPGISGKEEINYEKDSPIAIIFRHIIAGLQSIHPTNCSGEYSGANCCSQ